MRVAFVSEDDPTDFGTWSGTPRCMMQGMQQAGWDVHLVGPIKRGARSSLERQLTGLRNTFARDRSLWTRRQSVLRRLSNRVDKELDRIDFDVVLAYGSTPIMFSRYLQRSVIWADATLAGMRDYYPEFSNLSISSLSAIDEELLSLRECKLFVGATQWATRELLEGTPHSVVPYGANLRRPEPFVPQRIPGTVKLLTVGGDWSRKGMDAVVAARQLLAAKGRSVELDIVGAGPPDGTALVEQVRIWPRLNKRDPGQLSLLERLYRQADIFVLASEAECMGVVLAEAAAYGVPVVASDTGGIPDIVDKYGFGVTVRPTANAIADACQGILDQAHVRAAFSAAGRTAADTSLNWISAVVALKTEIERVGR